MGQLTLVPKTLKMLWEGFGWQLFATTTRVAGGQERCVRAEWSCPLVQCRQTTERFSAGNHLSIHAPGQHTSL